MGRGVQEQSCGRTAPVEVAAGFRAALSCLVTCWWTVLMGHVTGPAGPASFSTAWLFSRGTRTVGQAAPTPSLTAFCVHAACDGCLERPRFCCGPAHLLFFVAPGLKAALR